MKIRVLSDLHLEFQEKEGSPYTILPMEEDDNTILVLAGDIVCHDMIEDVLHDFLESASSQFKEVIYVAGNHEFYYGDFKKTHKKIKTLTEKFYNCHFLSNASVGLDDVLFIGSTLWTNFNNDKLSISLAKGQLNDFLGIIGNGKKDFCAEDAVVAYDKAERYIRRMVSKNKDKKIVLVTHFLPSQRSISPRFRGSNLNDYFATSLLDYVGLEGINLAIHGHTHDSVDYMIGSTRVVCNPYGYHGREVNRKFDPKKLIEI